LSTQVAKMPRPPKRNDLNVKIDSEVIRQARIVAAFEEIQLAELLSEILRPIIAKRLEKHTQRNRESD
jgi:hypothetical protein